MLFRVSFQPNCSHIDRIPYLCPSLLRESGQQQRWSLFLSVERCLEVIYGMALVLPDSQTQPADQLAVLDAVHVQRLPVVLLTGRVSRRTVALVLEIADKHKLKQQSI